MDEKWVLNNGIGSPGEMSRVMTKEFLKLKEYSTFEEVELLMGFLTSRSLIYIKNGFDIYDPQMIREIAICHYDNFPFAILVEIYLTNKVTGPANLTALCQNLGIVTEVVLENYNSLVPPSNRIMDIKELILDIEIFIRTNESPLQTGVLYVYQRENSASCLKFFSSGSVIYTDVEGDVLHTKSHQEKINKWFNQTYLDNCGVYIVEFNAVELITEIDFTIKNKSGTVYYSGEAYPDRLEMRPEINMTQYDPKISFYLISP